MLVALDRLGASPIAAGGMVRDLPRRERARAAAALGCADRAGRLALDISATAAASATIATSSPARLCGSASARRSPPTCRRSCPALPASALHSFMRLSLRRHARTIRRRSARRSAIGRRSISSSAGRPGRSRSPSDPAEVLIRLKPVEAFRHVEPELDLLWHFMREMAKKPEFRGVVDRLRIGPDSLRARRRGVARALCRHDGFLCASRSDRLALAAHPLAGAARSRSGAPLFLAGDRRALSEDRVPGPSFRRTARGMAARAHARLAGDQGGRRSNATTSTTSALTFSAFEEWKVLWRPALQVGRRAPRPADGVTPTLLANALLPDGRRVDIRREPTDKIAGIVEAGSTRHPTPTGSTSPARCVLPGPDRRAYPSRQDAARPAVPAAPAGRKRRRADRGREGAAARASLSRSRRAPCGSSSRSWRFGTVALRTHVDIDDEVGLDGLHALLKVRETVRDLIDIQIVAFPQSGIICVPGRCRPSRQRDPRRRRSRRRARSGRHRRRRDGPPRRDLRDRRAARRRRRHPPARSRPARLLRASPDRGANGSRRACRAASRSAMPSRSATSTMPSSSGPPRRLPRAGVAIMTNGPGPVPMPPVKRLVAAGVTVFAGSDNIRDAWSPYGNGDMLERAMLDRLPPGPARGRGSRACLRFRHRRCRPRARPRQITT